MKKGFTLIELLAVIVILAIIALIATPIVLNIINDTKESAVFRSAEFYLDAVENSIAKKSLSIGGSFSPNICEVQSNGDLLCDGKDELKIEVNGEKPSSGNITFDKGKITTVELTLSNKVVTKNEKGELVFVKKLNDICKPAKEQFFATNPLEAGYEYECEVKPGTKYNFYVLSTEEDGTINLIMDRNICEDGTPIEKGKTCLVAYNSSGDAVGTGPVTAMTYLNNATSSWENIENLNITYDDEGANFTDFAITGKARLPYYSEVSEYDWDTGINAYLYDNLEEYYFCYDNEEDYNEVPCDEARYIEGLYNNTISHIADIFGYWTLSSYADDSYGAWNVYHDGYVSPYGVDHAGLYGVRPVINLKI